VIFEENLGLVHGLTFDSLSFDNGMWDVLYPCPVFHLSGESSCAGLIIKERKRSFLHKILFDEQFENL
jgi:hypothetical protein